MAHEAEIMSTSQTGGTGADDANASRIPSDGAGPFDYLQYFFEAG
jgi:hypothetical protein